MIELACPVPPPFEDNGFNIQPLCLDTGEDLGDFQEGEDRALTALGFGYLSNDQRVFVDWLQYTKIHEMPLDQCRAKYGPLEDYRLPHNVIPEQLCAYDKRIYGTSDTCGGEISTKIFFI